MFGYGMALSGNCGYGALARLGGGDLRSFVIVLVAGISAFVVMSGPLAAVRVMIFPVNEITDQAVPSIAYLLADGLPVSAPVIGMTIAVIITAITFMGDDFHREHKAIFGQSSLALQSPVVGQVRNGLPTMDLPAPTSVRIPLLPLWAPSSMP